VFHKTSDLQDQDQDRFILSQIGIVLRTVVSDHITGMGLFFGDAGAPPLRL